MSLSEDINLGRASLDEIAIACSLSAADLGDRRGEWRALLDTSLVSVEQISSGVRISVQPSGSGELLRLIELERTCCAWMQFKFETPETVAITTAADGVEALVAMFLVPDDRPPTRREAS